MHDMGETQSCQNLLIHNNLICTSNWHPLPEVLISLFSVFSSYLLSTGRYNLRLGY